METKQPNFKQDFIPELEIEIKERKQIWDPHSEDIKTAYSKITELWNKDQKSRNFIKHLIAAHLPIDQWKRAFILEKGVVVKCAILGIELAGSKEISEGFAKLSMTKMFIDAKACTEERKNYTEEEIEKINSEREPLPKKVTESRVAYLSDKSDKVLSQEAIIALYYFSLNIIMFSEELNRTIRKRQFNDVMEKTETKLTKPETNQLVYKMKDNIKTDTFEKLLKMKEELEKNNPMKTIKVTPREISPEKHPNTFPVSSYGKKHFILCSDDRDIINIGFICMKDEYPESSLNRYCEKIVSYEKHIPDNILKKIKKGIILSMEIEAKLCFLDYHELPTEDKDKIVYTKLAPVFYDNFIKVIKINYTKMKPTEKRTINLKTFEGELIYLVGLAVQTNKEYNLDKDILHITEEMATENYAQTIQVFDREFNEYFNIIYK